MSKVILTQEQAKAIYKAINNNGKDDVISFHFRLQRDKKKWTNWYKPLNDLKAWELARALYIGYEVEPSFKAGDWVTYNDEAMDLVGKLVEGEKSKILQVDSSMYKHYQSIPYEYLRHATPEEIAEEKERRWWSARNRGVWELKVRDMLKQKSGNKTVEVKKAIDSKYLIGSCDYYESKEHVKKHYTVICLAENREDVEE